MKRRADVGRGERGEASPISATRPLVVRARRALRDGTGRVLPGVSAAGGARSPNECGRGERGEVLPVAILFVGVLFTILVGLHVVLLSMGRTAVRSAADRGVLAAQSTAPGPPTCGEPVTVSDPDTNTMVTTSQVATDVGSVPVDSERACRGVLATSRALRASGSMVGQWQPPEVRVSEESGIVSVTAFGRVLSPVLGNIEVTAQACGPLDQLASGGPTQADPSAC